MSDAPLKPCPFCFRSATVELWDTFDAGHIAYLHCESCGARGPSFYSKRGHEDALRMAREAWGRRHHPERVPP